MEEDLNFNNFTVTHGLKKKKKKQKSKTNQKYDGNGDFSFTGISEDLASEISDGHKVKRKKNKHSKKQNSKEGATKEKQRKRKHSFKLQEENSDPAAELYEEESLGDHHITIDTDRSFIVKKQETIPADSYEVEEWTTEHDTKKHRSKKKKKWKDKIRSSEDQVWEEIVELSYPDTENLNSGNERDAVPSSFENKLKKKKYRLQASVMSKSSREISSSGPADISELVVTEEEEEIPPVAFSNFSDSREAALNEMEEFIPHVRSLCRSTVVSLLKNDLPRFRIFKMLGIPIKHGRFTVEENKQIQRNVEKFLLLTGIDSADKLFNPNRYPGESVAIKQAKSQNQFVLQIAEGIPRTCRLVHTRAEKMFNIYNYKGRYTKEEEKKLKEYHTTCGNNWKAIGELMCRSNHSIALKYSQMKITRCHGPWSKEETAKLLMALEEVILNKIDPLMTSEIGAESPQAFLSILREKLYKGISWIEVEAKVGTRNWMQCKSKWTDLLATKMTQGQKVYSGYKGLQAKINMIKRLYEMQLEDSNEVNWEELADCIGDVPPSYVQAKFYKLKARHVPNWNKKTFPEIIDFLYENTLSVFEERLKKMKKKRTKKSCNQQKKTVFRIRDIFQYESSDSENE